MSNSAQTEFSFDPQKLRSQVFPPRPPKTKHVHAGQEGAEHLRLAGVHLLARVDGADAADAGHGGQGVQQGAAAGQAALVEEANRAQRPLH